MSFDNKCYYNDDLQVLIDFANINLGLESYHPILLGQQVWENNRLHELSLDDLWGIYDYEAQWVVFNSSLK